MIKMKCTRILLQILLSVFLNGSLLAGVVETDSLALLALYNSTATECSHLWWNLTNPVSLWNGITLNSSGTRVTEISIVNSEIIAPIWDFQCTIGFQMITKLYGSLPEELGNLTELRELKIIGQELEGGIPMSLGQLHHLQKLWLINDSLSGPVPESLYLLNEIIDLQLHNNQLTGSLSDYIINLVIAENINLENNDFSGCIPENLDYFCGTDVLKINGNPKLSWGGQMAYFCEGLPQQGATCDDGISSTLGDRINNYCICSNGADVNDINRASALSVIENADGSHSISFQLIGGNGHYATGQGYFVGNSFISDFLDCGVAHEIIITDSDGNTYVESFEIPCSGITCNFFMGYDISLWYDTLQVSFAIAGHYDHPFHIVITNENEEEILNDTIPPFFMVTVLNNHQHLRITNIYTGCEKEYSFNHSCCGNLDNQQTQNMVSSGTTDVCSPWEWSEVFSSHQCIYQNYSIVSQNKEFYKWIPYVQYPMIGSDYISYFIHNISFDPTYFYYNTYYYKRYFRQIMQCMYVSGPIITNYRDIYTGFRFLPPPGMICDNHNNADGIDIVSMECECVPLSSRQCPQWGLNIGDPCEDGLLCTTNTIVDSDCNCGGGSVIDTDNNGICDYDTADPYGAYELGQSCNDFSNSTINESILSDGTCGGGIIIDQDLDGIFDTDSTDNCVGLNIGMNCNDGIFYNHDDVINAECVCIGIMDANYCLAWGYIGDVCNDDDECTAPGTITNSCDCSISPSEDWDNDGICNELDDCVSLTGMIGDPCDDMLSYTIDDVVSANCLCMGTMLPEYCVNYGLYIGDTCDDMLSYTIDDVVTANCLCMGTMLPEYCVNYGLYIGDVCDDLNDDTSGDMIGPDCSCSGTTGFSTSPSILQGGLLCTDGCSAIIYDVQGRELLQYKIYNSIDKNLSPGIYFMKIVDGDTYVVSKIVR